MGAQGLVGTGCSTTIIASDLVKASGGSVSIMAFDGRKVDCEGTSKVELWVCGKPVTVRAVVAKKVIEGIDVVVGMDAIGQLGGVTINRYGVWFGTRPTQSVGLVAVNPPKNDTHCVIEDEDFHAEFDGENWVIKWFFERAPPELKNRVVCYENQQDLETKARFEREVEKWIEEGILNFSKISY